MFAEDLDKTAEVLEARLPKFFSGLVGLHKELGGKQQDVKNRNGVKHCLRVEQLVHENDSLHVYLRFSKA